MKLIPTEFPKTERYGKKQALVLEFMGMNVECVLVENPGTSETSFTSSFNHAAEKLSMPCRARMVNGKAYLVRNDK